MAREVSETITCDHTGDAIDPAEGRVVLRAEFYPGTPEDGPTYEVQVAGRDFGSLEAMVKAMPAVADELREGHQHTIEVREESRLQQERDRLEQERQAPPPAEHAKGSSRRSRSR